jgi:hypothetical protein
MVASRNSIFEGMQFFVEMLRASQKTDESYSWLDNETVFNCKVKNGQVDVILMKIMRNAKPTKLVFKLSLKHEKIHLVAVKNHIVKHCNFASLA